MYNADSRACQKEDLRNIERFDEVKYFHVDEDGNPTVEAEGERNTMTNVDYGESSQEWECQNCWSNWSSWQKAKEHLQYE